MDYFISMQPQSNVRFTALFLDSEEKSSFHLNDFPSMILQKIICVFHVLSTGIDPIVQNLDKELSFTNQFLEKKSQEDKPEKTNTKVEVQSMVTVPIHQDTLSVPLMTSSIIDLTVSPPASTTVQASLPTSTTTTAITTTTTLPPPLPQPQQGVSNSIIIQQIGELEQSIADQVDINQALEERLDKQGNRIHQLETQDLSRMIREQTVEYIDKQEIDQKIEETVKEEILLQCMLEENYDKGHEDHWMAYKALQKSILPDESKQFDADKAKEHDQSLGSATPGSSKTVATTAYTAWTMTTSKFEPSTSSIPKDVFMHEESDFAAQDMMSDDEDIGSRHIPRVNLNQDWFKPLSEDERPATPELAWSIPSSSLPVPIHNWASTIASSYVPPPENSLLSQTSDIGVFIDWFCRNKGDRLALSITKMKVAYYPDVGLEQMVPDQIWIEEECMYDIFATYGISHWWFKRQKFYIDRHSAKTNQRAIGRTHMRILSVVSIDVFSIYGYDYMKQIVLRRSNNQEYTIAKNDFKDLYPSDFEDLYLLNLQGHLNHLPPRDKKILSSAVNLWIRNLVIRQWVEDFQLGIESY
ncbi:hypothetical protein Tco_0543177 [Tanacetum coccineum]